MTARCQAVSEIDLEVGVDGPEEDGVAEAFHPLLGLGVRGWTGRVGGGDGGKGEGRDRGRGSQAQGVRPGPSHQESGVPPPSPPEEDPAIRVRKKGRVVHFHFDNELVGWGGGLGYGLMLLI